MERVKLWSGGDGSGSGSKVGKSVALDVNRGEVHKLILACFYAIPLIAPCFKRILMVWNTFTFDKNIFVRIKYRYIQFPNYMHFALF